MFRLRGTRRPPPRPPRSTTLERSLPRSVVDARAGPPAVDQVNASADVEPDQPDDACSIPSQLLTVEMLRRPLESTLAALVRVVDHTGRPPLSQRHVERVQYELGAQMIRHRPADDPSTPRIDHHRQIQEPGPCRHVRDVRHPQLVSTRCSEVTLDEIRGRTRVAILSRRPRSPSTRDPLDPGSAHESRDPLATDRYAVGGELGVDPRNPVGPSRALVLPRAKCTGASTGEKLWLGAEIEAAAERSGERWSGSWQVRVPPYLEPVAELSEKAGPSHHAGPAF